MKKVLAVLVVLTVMAPISVYAGKYDDVLVQADGNCSKPCVVIGKVSRQKKTIFGKCTNKLKKYAKKKYDADAILNYKLVSSRFLCEGIAVRWAKPGEEGIMKITEDIPIPVIN